METESLDCEKQLRLFEYKKADRKVGRKMILQHYVHGGEVYLEADCIALYEVDISQLEEKTDEKVLEHLINEVPCCKGHNIIDECDLFGNDSFKKCNKLNIVTMSDAEEKSNNKVLLFGENETVYLLNNSGKTIRKL